jgi:hypothetical protein
MTKADRKASRRHSDPNRLGSRDFSSMNNLQIANIHKAQQQDAVRARGNCTINYLFHAIAVLTMCTRSAPVESPKSKSEHPPSLTYYQAHHHQNRKNRRQHCPSQWRNCPRLHELGRLRPAQTNARHLVARNSNYSFFE